MVKGKVFYGQEPPTEESTTTECRENYLPLAAAEWGLLVAVDHNQLRTMATGTVDPIDWWHPPPSWAYPLSTFVHSINQCSLSWNRSSNRQYARQPPYLCRHSGFAIVATVCADGCLCRLTATIFMIITRPCMHKVFSKHFKCNHCMNAVVSLQVVMNNCKCRVIHSCWYIGTNTWPRANEIKAGNGILHINFK